MDEQREHCDQLDLLEAELASFRPPPVSRELRERIEAELAVRPRRTWAMAGSVAALAAAACVIVGVAIWTQPTTIQVNLPPLDPARIEPAMATSTRVPTVMDYRRALAESQDAVDALLARRAGGSRDETQPDKLFTAFDRSAMNLTTDTGESL